MFEALLFLTKMIYDKDAREKCQLWMKNTYKKYKDSFYSRWAIRLIATGFLCYWIG